VYIAYLINSIKRFIELYLLHLGRELIYSKR